MHLAKILSSLEWCPNWINMFCMPGVPPRWTIPTPWTAYRLRTTINYFYGRCWIHLALDPLEFGVVPRPDRHVLHTWSPASMDNSDALDYLGIEPQSAIFFTKGDDGLILLITLSSLEWCPNRMINMFYMPGVPPRWTIPTPWTP